MKIYSIGIGPGDENYIAPKALEVINNCDVVVGYTTYIKIIKEIIEGKEIISTGMKSEVKRCQAAFDEAKKGKKVAVVSSGDSGIYGMATLLLEMTENYDGIKIEVIPGITAANAAAAILGSPISNDFATVSLSDLLTPWEVIEKRLEAVGLGDFVVCIYNPQSKTRVGYVEKACEILMRHKKPETICGYVKNANRVDEFYELCRLDELKDKDINMFTTIIVGNETTKIINGRMVTPRGYTV